MDNKALEVCKNLKRTIDNLTEPTTVGDSSIRGNNPWAALKPSKKKLENKLKYIMRNNKFTDEQIR
tara:strand:- start:178 stop:375 length:198 start_codon:yes stop_codon:yes gene_type:complete